MNPARIAELLLPFLGAQTLSPAQLSSISTYIDILLRWNARVNLTAIRGPEEIVTRHFGESFFAAAHLFPSGSSALAGEVPPCPSVSPVVKACKVADLGSGAGFPGLPIKLWAPHISLTLIESNHKKATFLREVVRALTLTGVNIQNARAETLPAHAYDLVTLRAVERFEAVLPIASSLVADDGRLALLIGTIQLAQLPIALSLHDISAPLPIPSSSSRVLVVAQKPAAIR
ncbi:MAG: 16S rRNA (guanine(527)-N(7))-methyltransferase RsmG [Candidatus Sulfotelmatobacter sp.]